MLAPVKRAIRKAFHAAGYALVPLPERIRERTRPGVFDYAPDASHMTEQGRLDLIDGVLSARNPALAVERT